MCPDGYNWSAHTDTQQPDAASWRMLSAVGLGRWTTEARVIKT